MDWDFWCEKVELAKGEFARLIGASPDEIAVSTSVSEIISSIAGSFFPHGHKRKILTTDAEFPTVEQVWLAHEKWGTQVDYIPLSHGQIDLEEYRKRVNENTLLVPATHVYYQNGFKQDSQGFTFIDPQRNILITPGSDSGLFYAMFPFLEPGDEVLIPDPSYPNNTQNATLMGAVAVHVPLRPEDGYRLPVEEFRRLCTDRTKMVVLTNPNNPTSTVFSKAEISELCRLIDGTGAPAVEQGYLLVENGMIRSIGAIQDLQDRRKPESTQPDCAQPDGNRGTFPESGWSLSP